MKNIPGEFVITLSSSFLESRIERFFHSDMQIGRKSAIGLTLVGRILKWVFLDLVMNSNDETIFLLFRRLGNILSTRKRIIRNIQVLKAGSRTLMLNILK